MQQEIIRLADELATSCSDEVAEITSRLIQFKTDQPVGDTSECAAWIKAWFDACGIVAEIHGPSEQHANVVATVPGASASTVVWLGHIDVVPSGSDDMWDHPPYAGVISDGNVYGRGSSDMKGACAAAMVMARLLTERDTPPPSTWQFWFTCDEEIGGRDGARWVCEQGILKGDACLIGDGGSGGYTRPNMDLGCKGAASTHLISRGQTAHGSTPFLGDNALRKLIDAIPSVEGIAQFPLELPAELDQPLEDSVTAFVESQDLSAEQAEAAKRLYRYPTVTCNILHAGQADNVVPDYAEATFDIRLTPGCDTAAVKAEIERLVAEAAVPGVSVDVRVSDQAGFYASPDGLFALAMAEAIKDVTGKRPLKKILTGGTDGISVDRIVGIPAVGYGASLFGQAHQPNEYVTVENLVLALKVYLVLGMGYEG